MQGQEWFREIKQSRYYERYKRNREYQGICEVFAIGIFSCGNEEIANYLWKRGKDV